MNHECGVNTVNTTCLVIGKCSSQIKAMPSTSTMILDVGVYFWQSP